MKIRLWRDKDGIAQTNVPHAVVRHSPSGFEWNYAGSGPADLSLNILLLFLSEKQANGLYQTFKREVIENVPWEGGEIDEEFVKAWIRSHSKSLAQIDEDGEDE